jgi:hypothetical protein
MEDEIAARAAAEVWADGLMCLVAASFLGARCPRVVARLVARGAELVELAQAWELAAAEGRRGSPRTPIQT